MRHSSEFLLCRAFGAARVTQPLPEHARLGSRGSQSYPSGHDPAIYHSHTFCEALTVTEASPLTAKACVLDASISQRSIVALSMSLTPAAGLLLSGAIPVLFVAPFYCHPKLAWSPRNDAATVAFRLAGAAVAAVAAVALVALYPADCGMRLWDWIGVGLSWQSIMVPICMLGCVYCGAFVALMVGARRMAYTAEVPMHVKFRNLVAGPFLEEITFRACSCRVLLAAGFTPVQTASIAPLFFGIAHAHHVVELIRCRGQTVYQAAMQQLALFVQTSLFGFFACVAYLSLGSLAAPALLHIGCNWFGMPWLGQRSGMSVVCYRTTQCLSIAGLVLLFVLTKWLLSNPHTFATHCQS